ncbi:MAG: hypothetical protein AAFZ65_15425, partial [Planctomycetota bacterium]
GGRARRRGPAGPRPALFSRPATRPLDMLTAALLALPQVDLDLLPTDQCVPPNSVVSVELVLSADTPEWVAAVDLLLVWNPSELTLLSGSPVGSSWNSGGFLNDPDGINQPTNDGDALFTLFANLASPPLVSGALTSASFDFFATNGGQITVPATLGVFGSTRVIGVLPGSNSTGDLPDPVTIGVVAPTASVESVRLGTVPNPDVLRPGQTSGPVVGATWDPRIDHTTFVPNALLDVLAFSLTPLDLPIPGLGTVLCLPPSVVAPVEAVPGQPFAVPIPTKCTLVGASLCSQALSIDPFGAIQLTNALDITIGTF